MGNVTAWQVASELRRVAEAFDRHPDVEVCTVFLSFLGDDYMDKDAGKQRFINTVKILPRPLKKTYGPVQVEVECVDSPVHARAYINRSAICEIIEPARAAVYHCPPLLYDEEVEEAVQSF